MTEDDARRLAKQYGMDYDTFIANYIIGGGVMPVTPQITTINNAPTARLKM